MLLKLCRCGKLIEQSERMCKECEEKYKAQRKEYEEKHKDRHIKYNREKRNKKHARFYNSNDWLRLRSQILQRFNYIDVYQLYANNKFVNADMVHHIIEIEEDWSKRFDIDNLIPLSSSTHNTISALYRRSQKKKRETQQLLYKFMERYLNEIGGDSKK